MQLVAGHQLSKYLGTFNWKIWLAHQTLEQITINSFKGAEKLERQNFREPTVDNNALGRTLYYCWAYYSRAAEPKATAP